MRSRPHATGPSGLGRRSDSSASEPEYLSTRRRCIRRYRQSRPRDTGPPAQETYPMTRTAVLGFPRIGADRELKRALEDHWAGRSSDAELEALARSLRAAHLRTGAEAGIDMLPVGDFALYDHVLDAAELVGITAERHGGGD